MSYCKRRAVTVQILDINRVLLMESTNGTLNGLHGGCQCPDSDVPAGYGGSSTRCFGVHAEYKALIGLSDYSQESFKKAHILKTSKAPCLACVNMILGTTIEEIEFETPSRETANRDRWEERKGEGHWNHVGSVHVEPEAI